MSVSRISIFVMHTHRATVACCLMILCVFPPDRLLGASRSTPMAAEVPLRQQPAEQPSGHDAAADELQNRLQAAAAAKKTGAPAAVAQANVQVLALALRKLANIRTTERAFPEAAELYRRSLALEDARSEE